MLVGTSTRVPLGALSGANADLQIALVGLRLLEERGITS